MMRTSLVACLFIGAASSASAFLGSSVTVGRQVFGASACRSTAPRAGCAKTLGMAMQAEFDLKKVAKEAEDKMKKSVDKCRENMQTLRTGRANPTILDRVTVECYGMESPLNQVATVKTTGAQQLVVEVYDKSILNDVEKAILESGVGLTPTNDGNVLRLTIPPVTEDRRKELCKEAKGMGEEGKVAIRNIRRDAVDAIKKAEKSKDISQDQSKDGTGDLQKLTEKYTKAIDDAVAAKEKDIMKI